jgi:thioredoxin 1
LSKTAKILVILIIVVVIAGGILIKKGTNHPVPSASTAPPLPTTEIKGPILYEFGSSHCIPCKEMAPIIKALTEEYNGIISVQKIDVNENRKMAERFKVQFIPCQILLNKDGQEVFRHYGVIKKEALVKNFEKVGVKPLGK